jgi:hypothetical protein
MELHDMEEYFGRVPTGACRMSEHEANRAFPRRGSHHADPTGVDERAIGYAKKRGLVCVMLPGGGFEFRKPKL